MAGVEFVEDHADVPPEQLADPRRRNGPTGAGNRLRPAASAVLFAASAVLCALASVGTLYELSLGTGASGFSYRVNAWGTYSGVGQALQQQHEARYAWPLLACAVVFALLVVHTVAQPYVPRARHSAGAARLLAVAAVGVLGGVLLGMYLHADAFLAGERTRAAADAAVGDPVRTDIVTRIGDSVTLALIALVCGFLAVLVRTESHRVTARASRSPAP